MLPTIGDTLNIIISILTKALLSYLADDVTVGDAEVGWGEAIVLGATVHLAEGADTGITAHVQMTGQ